MKRMHYTRDSREAAHQLLHRQVAPQSFGKEAEGEKHDRNTIEKQEIHVKTAMTTRNSSELYGK